MIILFEASIPSSPLWNVLIAFQKYDALFLCVFIVLFMTHSINEIWTDSLKVGTVSKDRQFSINNISCVPLSSCLLPVQLNRTLDNTI